MYVMLWYCILILHLGGLVYQFIAQWNIAKNKFQAINFLCTYRKCVCTMPFEFCDLCLAVYYVTQIFGGGKFW